MDCQVKLLDTSCYLICQALDIDGQITLFEDIQSKDRQSSGPSQPPNKPKALYPSPRTVPLGTNKTKIKYERSTMDANIYSGLVDQANDAILQASTIKLGEYKSITLSAIEYEAGKHSLAEHVDHDDSFVYLLSLGCTTNFVIKGPSMAEKTTIPLKSGDLIVFDASTTGKILHGIDSIDDGESACPVELANRFPILRNHRYGIQLRVRF